MADDLVYGGSGANGREHLYLDTTPIKACIDGLNTPGDWQHESYWAAEFDEWALEWLAGLVSDVHHREAEADALRARLAAAEKVLAAISDLHRPIRIYDECDHPDCAADPIEVFDYTACADSFIGWACETCCYDDEQPMESCPHGGDHQGTERTNACPTTTALAEGEASQ